MTAQTADRGIPFVSGSARLVYYDSGPHTTRPLVLIAGGPGFDRTYMHVGDAFEQLARTHRVVGFDQRGTGASSAFEDHLTNDDYIDDIEALRTALGVESFDLLGHSFGGYLAMGYAVKYPNRVRQLVLVDSVAPKRSDTKFIFAEAFPERIAAYNSWRAAIRERDVETATSTADVYLSMLFCDPAKHAAWARGAAHVGFYPIATGTLWAEANGPDLTAAVRELRVPTLVMTGRYDMNIPVRVSHEIANAIPDARLHVFERSGHMPFFEEPEAFVETLRSFLDQPLSVSIKE